MHCPKTDFTRLASFFIVTEHFREGLFKLQSDALPHDPLGIHRVLEGIDWGFEQISLGDFDHYNLNNTTMVERQPRAGDCDSESRALPAEQPQRCGNQCVESHSRKNNRPP